MALTRSALREKGVTDKEVLDYIMDEHGLGIETAKEKTEESTKKIMQKTIDTLQEKIDNAPKPDPDGKDWKAEYENLSKTVSDEDGKTWKEKYDALNGEFDTYKQTLTTEKTTTAQNKALQNALKGAGANEKMIPLLMKDIDRTTVKFDGDIEKGFTIKNADDILKPVKEQYADVFGKTKVEGVNPANPPANDDAHQDLFIAGFDGK